MVHIVQQIARRLRQQGGKANDEPAEDEKDNGRSGSGGDASKLARRVARKAMAVSHSSQEPSQMAVVKNVAR